MIDGIYIYIYIWSPPARATHTCTTTTNTDGRHVERNKLEEEKEEPAAETDMHVLDKGTEFATDTRAERRGKKRPWIDRSVGRSISKTSCEERMDTTTETACIYIYIELLVADHVRSCCSFRRSTARTVLRFMGAM
jgi:hypothetical protein